MEQKRWVEGAKETIQAITDTMSALAEIRDEIESWGMTRKQADKLCVTMLEAALGRDR